MSRNKTLSRTLDKIRIKDRIRRDYINGITSYDELARRHDIPRQKVNILVNEIRQQLIEQDDERAGEERALAIERYLDILTEAKGGFTRSRNNAEEITTISVPEKCKYCKGIGFQDGGEECPICDGEGVVITQRTKRVVRGQAGDPRYLKIQIETIKEICRIQNLGGKQPDTVKNVNITQNNTTVDLSNVSDDKLLKALEAMDELRKEKEAIDVEVKQIENNEGNG